MLYFVSGVTGNVGGAAARRLLEEGHSLRTLSRNPQKAAEWAKKGVDVRQGDLNKSADLAAALEGIEGAFLMLPPVLVPAPGYPEANAIIASFLPALRQNPPKRIVALSSFGSEQTSGLGNITTTHLMEEALKALPIPVAFVRAGSFFENYAGALETAASTGVFYSFLQPTDRPVPMAATDDIGKEVAKLLVGDWSGRKIVELGSRIAPDELAKAMGAAIDRPVRAQAIPRDRWAATLESFGMAPGTTGAYEEMLDGINSGWIDFGFPGAEPVAGTVTPAQFFRQLKEA